MPKILLVDDEVEFRDLLKEKLETNSYQVLTAGDGKTALNILGIEDVDLVVTDIKMPGMTGIELLHWIRRTKMTPVVLMTGFLTELRGGEQEATDLGAVGFVSKPFDFDRFMNLISGILRDKIKLMGASDGTTIEDPVNTPAPEISGLREKLDDEEFSKVGIEDFVAGKQMPYDVFIRIRDGEYIKVAQQGEGVDLERLRAYKKRNVRFLHLRKTDWHDYIKKNLRLTQVVMMNPSVPKEKKQHIIKHTGEVIAQKLFVEGITAESFEEAKNYTEGTVSFLAERADALSLLESLNGHADWLYAHSLGVSMYGVMIAKKLGWPSAATAYKISMGGLFHDIGKKELDRALLDKPRRDLTKAEVDLLASHPTRGVEILSKLDFIPTDIIQIVYEHHENCIGTGYPRALKKNRIHPLARLIYVANSFCNYVVASPASPAFPVKEAVERMEQLGRDAMDHEVFQALKKVLNII